jgi:hypothetical protein
VKPASKDDAAARQHPDCYVLLHRGYSSAPFEFTTAQYVLTSQQLLHLRPGVKDKFQ